MIIRMGQSTIVALIQNNATSDESVNVNRMNVLLDQAIDTGASLIALPEMFHFRRQSSVAPIPSHSIDSDFISYYQSFSKKHRVALLLGSFCETIVGSDKVFNTSVFIDDHGAIAGVYRKIHLFDATVGSTIVRESQTFESGTEPVTLSWKLFKLGMSICYDLRFPELYRYYVNQNCTLLTVPASFTYTTGKKHWESLLRARAIENQCYVLAPNQVGIGAGGVPTFGHSMIIDPDGKILREADGETECVLSVEISDINIAKARSVIPCLEHQKKRQLFQGSW